MDTTHTQKSGSLFGAILLITGCCIGAGMLGLPVISSVAGFKPSFFMFLLSWLFMTTTALLLLEVNLWFTDEVSLISMAGRTLGIVGKVLGWACFLFLFYALGVAYISGTGELIASFIHEKAGFLIPPWVGSVLVSLLFGFFIYFGTLVVDRFNRFLMAGLIVSYIILVAIGFPHVEAKNLAFENWSAAALVLPVMIISFGFHNMIPSLTIYLKGNAKQLRLAIICGSCLALGVYLIWEWLILGLVPVDAEEGFLQIMDEGSMATELLKHAGESVWVIDAAQYFAFFAILTSFLGNSLSFVDFLSDGLRIKKTMWGKLALCLLVIVPPFSLSLIYPKIFLIALNYAGAFGAVILFGILPALMVWSGRYVKKIGIGKQQVPGGKALLAAIILFCVWIMGMQLVSL